MTGESPVTADDVRQIVRDEISGNTSIARKSDLEKLRIEMESSTQGIRDEMSRRFDDASSLANMNNSRLSDLENQSRQSAQNISSLMFELRGNPENPYGPEPFYKTIHDLKGQGTRMLELYSEIARNAEKQADMAEKSRQDRKKLIDATTELFSSNVLRLLVLLGTMLAIAFNLTDLPI